MTGADHPNRCATCPRQNVTLFDGRCGRCAYGVSTRADDLDAGWREALHAAEVATLQEEIRRLKAALRRAHEANEALYDYTGGRAA